MGAAKALLCAVATDAMANVGDDYRIHPLGTIYGNIRIMAMIMIMGLALLVYALAQRHIRRPLALHNETIPDQKGKPTQTPTMRRIPQIFEGIDLLIVRQHDQIVARHILNLTDVRRQIINLFGTQVHYCYLVEF